ncbi:hypothetical protein NQ317_016222 [Molorchus minor]|uniref:C2H2-type domain-containing protein n=1 Tax=Molorchus minor TaxID=1323400 RepID=A0ABQ9J804_9CUCU|nr:hypothetical protein NQ317_016222 [Molorchus minor]
MIVPGKSVALCGKGDLTMEYYVTCASCVDFLTAYNKLATTCEGTEEKISLCCKIQQNEAIIKLRNVLTFLGNGNQYNDVSINDNTEDSLEGPDVKEVFVEVPDSSKKCKRGNGEVYKCTICKYQAKQVKMYKCEMYEYQTKYKTALKSHFLYHKDISEVEVYKCNKCEYQTKYRRSLIRHLLNHKNISEVQMYKCEICEYQTKHKGYLKKHLLVHDNISEVQLFKCEMCEISDKTQGGP